mgnify:CR=1 FL=1
MNFLLKIGGSSKNNRHPELVSGSHNKTTIIAEMLNQVQHDSKFSSCHSCEGRNNIQPTKTQISIALQQAFQF